MTDKQIKLKVAEAVQDDVNKGIARIDNTYLREIGVKAGEIVEIEGDRKTVVIADRAYPGDIGLNIIRMDGISRRNAKAGIGDLITIRKVEVKEGKKIVIAPVRKGIIVKANPLIFKHGLLGRALVKGDIVALGGTSRRRTAMSASPYFPELFDILEDDTLGMGFGFGDLKFVVIDAQPAKTPVFVSEGTEIELSPEAAEVKDEKTFAEVSYEDIGGLSEEIKKVREMVELPLKHPEIFERLGIDPPKGVLLHGPPGTGKTLLAKAVANETNSHFILINGPEIMSKFYGQSEENIRKKFEEAEKSAPSIIFIDEIDAISSKREETHGEVERRVVAQLLALMDGLQSRGKVVVIAATNIPNSLDPALRRPGRFDREIEIGVPDKIGRHNILKIHTRNMPLADDISVLRDKKDVDKEYRDALADLFQYSKGKNLKGMEKRISAYLADNPGKSEMFTKLDAKKLKKIYEEVVSDPKSVNMHEVASITHGFVGADLSALSKEAAMIVLRKVLPDLVLKEEESIPQELLDKLLITMDDFKEALKVVRPSALREVLIEMPSIKWEQVGGLAEAKRELKEAVEWPLQNPVMFTRLGVRPPKGILLYGPPGTGKTLLAKAVATESQANFISVKGPELLSKWVGESEKAVREVFKKARQASPSIIFFDEFDSIAPRRGAHQDSAATERVVNQLLTEIDGIIDMEDVVIIAATNRPDMIDPGLLRPGRFDRIIFIGMPNEEARRAIFDVHSSKMKLGKDVDLKSLAERTSGYAGSDIEAVCREAAMMALRENLNASAVMMKHFEEAMGKVPPSLNEDIEKQYSELKDKLTSARARQMKEEKPSYFG